MLSNTNAPDHQWRNLATIQHLKPIGPERPELEQTCYRNALFILLLHTPVFLNQLQDLASLCSSQDGHDARLCSLCTFNEIAELFWSVRDLPRQRTLIENIWRKACDPEWDIEEQHDLMEFFEVLLDHFQRNSALELDPLSTLFRTQYSTHKVCEKCGQEGVSGGKFTYNGMNCYPAGVAPNEDQVTYQHILSNHFQLEYREDYECENEDCHTKGRTRFETKLDDLPEVFLIHINTGSSLTRPKLKYLMPVQLDESITLSSTTGRVAEYELYGVISHIGGSEFGHYVASVKAPSGNFVHFDDDNREEINLNTLQQHQTRKTKRRSARSPSDWTVYLLAFRKVNQEDFLNDLFEDREHRDLNINAEPNVLAEPGEGRLPELTENVALLNEEAKTLPEEPPAQVPAQVLMPRSILVPDGSPKPQFLAQDLQGTEPIKEISVWVEGSIRIDGRLLSGVFLDELKLPAGQALLLTGGGPRFRGQKVELSISLWEDDSNIIAKGELVGRVKTANLETSTNIRPLTIEGQKSVELKEPTKTRKSARGKKRTIDNVDDGYAVKIIKAKPQKRRKRNL